MKQISYIFLFTFLILHSSIANAIEISGHLTQNTTWSPEHNPYQVVENLFVDEGVTLTILPGTEVEVASTSLTSLNDYDQKFWFPSNEAKMIWVDGNIVAVGTQQDSIHFTRMNDVEDDFWGCIYFSDTADLPIFKHCRFEYSAGIGIWVGHTARTVLSPTNGKISVDKCYFYCNAGGVSFPSNPIHYAEVLNSTFFNNPYHDNFGQNYWAGGHCDFNAETLLNPGLFANNTLFHYNVYGYDGYIINNVINIGYISVSDGYTDSYFYNNLFEHCNNYGFMVDGRTAQGEPKFFFKRNRLIGNGFGTGIKGEYAYMEISNNYLDGCDVVLYQVEGKYYNNISKESEAWIPGDIEVYNNIGYNSQSYGLLFGYNPYYSNNISVNNQYAIWNGSITYNNSVIINNNELTHNNLNGNPIFRNCIIDFPLEPPLVDGGGNIIVDSLQALEIFEDIENGDFHLAAGSIAIDAGFDTLGYYYPFDIGNSVRVWDGDGDGNAIIDIGAYEYGAPQLGKISGYITETDTGDPVDYVLIKADNEPGEFTFAYSSGYFEIQLPEGTYDLYAERVFYEDNVIYTVTVNNEETTEIEFNMTSNFPHVGIDEDEVPIYSKSINLMNYPNPFNPSTTISYSLAEDSQVELTVYNIKGQKVKTLVNEELPRGKHSILWDGRDSNNNSVSSGVYLYKLKTEKEENVKRMILMK